MPENPSGVVKSMQPVNVLIVDDSATMRMVIRRVIDLAEVPIGTVYEATNGLEAIRILEASSVHAVFTDINMPVMSGYDLLDEMARRKGWSDILLVVVSTDGSRLRREEARELNVHAYIQKPFRPEAVRNALSRIANADAR